ncbi:hypothetical protein ACF0H5_016794 [Mactra antiquata]
MRIGLFIRYFTVIITPLFTEDWKVDANDITYNPKCFCCDSDMDVSLENGSTILLPEFIDWEYKREDEEDSGGYDTPTLFGEQEAQDTPTCRSETCST